ncbi:OmpP1/FadL family transporter [Abyssalbus ytuae]|uniref:Outer membrane protein transport protein n=1 Tax=Abyssalbus ytuae TaxID=2926907 RepID=A0A9E6ZW62_9FLAO|nr:outer membrane protein transport protein [Abyssalbus ytuae]UOB18883.1 outer membrane protein transport protein [Abyssalbus ytuae]
MKKLILSATIFFIVVHIYAGGYRVALQGQKQLAMGHTGVAVINSAELVFFNPGGITYLHDDFTVSVGMNAIFNNITFRNEEFGWNTKADNEISTPFSAYMAYKITDWLSVGLGVYTPYGSSTSFPTDWEGSHLVNNISLAAIFVQPTLSIKLNDKLSIGGGPIYMNGNVEYNRNLNRGLVNEQGQRSNVTIEQSGITAWGYNLGMMFLPGDKTVIGINYRSEIIAKAKNGDATFRNIPATLSPLFPDQGFNAELPLPAELTVGISYKITDKWLVAADFNRVFWNSYESLDIDFLINTPALPDSVNPRNYHNTSTYRFGAQYTANNKFVLRGGYYYDETPIPSGYFAPEIPRNDSHNFTGGLTYNFNNNFSIDFSLLYVHFEKLTDSYNYYQENGVNIPFGGTYENNALIPGLGVTYSF